MTTNLNETFAAVQAASRELALLNDDTINQILNAVADAAIAKAPFILAENEKDLARMVKSRAEGLLEQSDLQCQFFQSAQSPFRFGQVIDFCLQQRTHLLVGLFYMICFHVY